MIHIKTDSRKIRPGDTFVAVQCEVNDGHRYIKNAIENGAAKIVAQHGDYNIPYEIVKDTRDYLNHYLSMHYNKYLEEMTVIGITGTNGKTTSAYLIYDALNKLGKKCAYIGTVGFYMDKKICNLPNTNPDVCDMYDMMITAYDEGYRHIVIEASSQGLAGKRLEGIPFDIAIFTNLTQDHLDYHKTMENYALSKQLLFQKLKPHGVSVINYDDAYKEYFKTDNTIYYGFTGGDYHITSTEFTNHNTQFTYQHKNEHIEINSPLLGDYNISNLLTAIITLEIEHIPLEHIKQIIPKLSSPPGRMDMVAYKTNSIIIDYAHTPDAIEKIITTSKRITKGNIYVVFGCTGDRDRTKRPIMTKLVTDNAKKAIITIDDLHDEDPKQIVEDMLKGLDNWNYEVCLDRKKAIIKGIEALENHDTLLILGKGHEEAIIVKDKKIPFNDKEIVLEYLNQNNKIEI